MPPQPTFVFKNSMGAKKSKCENHIKWDLKRCRMMRGFQIWSQNSNWIPFDPLFGQKTVENRLNRLFCKFSTFFGPKGVKCHSIWILRPDLESSYHSASLRIPFDIITSGARSAERSSFLNNGQISVRAAGRPASDAFEKLISPELSIRASRGFHCRVDPFHKNWLQPDRTHLGGRPGG